MDKSTPITFKISKYGKHYVLKTTDSRAGTNRPSPEITATQVMATMSDLTEIFGKHGVSVNFEMENCYD